MSNKNISVSAWEKPNKGYTTIENDCVQDTSLSWGAKGLHLYLFSRSRLETWDFNKADLIQRSSNGRESMETMLKELQDKGYLDIVRLRNEETGRFYYQWTIYEIPKHLYEGGLPDTGKPGTGNPYAGNNKVLNNTSIKNKNNKNKTTTVSNDKKIIFDTSKAEFQNISDDEKARWQKTYPAIDIHQEILKAAAWLDANPKNQKSNYKRFLTNWFSRAQDKAPRVDHSGSSSEPKAQEYYNISGKMEHLLLQDAKDKPAWLKNIYKKSKALFTQVVSPSPKNKDKRAFFQNEFRENVIDDMPQDDLKEITGTYQPDQDDRARKWPIIKNKYNIKFFNEWEKL